METVDGYLTCVVGGMQLSPAMRTELVELVTSEPGPPGRPATFRWGGTWHCPADGSAMVEAKGRLSCPRCSRHVSTRILYQLVEFYSHN